MDVRNEKAALKQSVQQRIVHLNARARAAESRSVCRRMLTLLPVVPSPVCAYYPLKDEVDVRPFLRSALEQGHALYLPRFESGRLAFRRVTDIGSLPIGKLDLRESPADGEELPAAGVPLVFVPGRAFSRAGDRLGRGNGGYDIWIRSRRPADPGTRYVGVAFEAQIVERVPTEAHDEPMDDVVTARGTLKKAA